ncbi:MAG: TadE family protein [Planctomycetota bacterium]
MILVPTESRLPRRHVCVLHRKKRHRRGQSLLEFALVALVVYFLLAGILTFGHALFVAQGLQTAVDVGAREISRTPLPADGELEALLADGSLAGIYDDDFLVFDLANLSGGQNFFVDIVPTWPTLNQQLATMMIVDRPDLDGDGTADANFLRYPGALLTADPANPTPTGYTVGIPVVTSRDGSGSETIRWVPVVEEIDTENNDDGAGASPDPFRVSSSQRGIVALRINYPFQSASMSSFRPSPAGPFEPNLGLANVAVDEDVVEENPAERPGGLTGATLPGGGTYGGQYGLGAQDAVGGNPLNVTGGLPVRPYRRVISAQAIYRREVFE